MASATVTPAAVNAGMPSLLDHVKRLDPNGKIAKIVELLTQRNPLLQDMVWQEGNLTTGHRFTSRTALPGVSYRRLNRGVDPTKSRTAQVDETCCLMEQMSAVDCEEARLNGNEAAFRASEDAAHLQAMQNELESGMFYNSTVTAPEKFDGLSPRYTSTTQANGGNQLVKADAAANGSDNTSIWGVVWGAESVFGIFPKGMSGGLVQKDLGEQMWEDSDGKKFLAYVSDWTWRPGLCVKDFRQVTRVCNIDTGNLTPAAGADLVESMIKGYYRIQAPSAGRLVWYCNRTIATYLHLQARNTVKNSTLTIETIEGKPVTMFMGAPIHVTDALLNNEAAL